MPLPSCLRNSSSAMSYNLHCTKKLLDHTKQQVGHARGESTALLGKLVRHRLRQRHPALLSQRRHNTGTPALGGGIPGPLCRKTFGFSQERRFIAVHKAHIEISAESPALDANVKRTMHGIRRTPGTKQRQVRPMVRDDLREALVILDRQVDRTRNARTALADLKRNAKRAPRSRTR